MTKRQRENEFYVQLGSNILDASISVHKELGPGLLESVYHFALLKEFELRGIQAKSQVPVNLFYKGFDTEKHFLIDMLIEDEVIIELKSVDVLHPVYKAQIISYLKLSDKYLGYLINFKVPLLKDGFHRLVNNFL